MSRPRARFAASTLATPEAISELTDKVMAFLDGHGVDHRATHHTALVVSEILTNLWAHGDCHDRPARIAVRVEAGKVRGEIIDMGPPFDPTLAPEPSLDAAASDRPVGGLGLHLVRKLSCTLEYVRRNEENCTRFAITRSASGPASGSGAKTKE